MTVTYAYRFERKTMITPTFLSYEELEASLAPIRESPRETGTLQWIVRRPSENEREVLNEGQLDTSTGLVGDSWQGRRSAHEEESAHLSRQLTLMNARVIALLAQSQERWELAGDQLFVDFDLSTENLPTGTRIQIGEAIVEVSAKPHTGCKKFQARFGEDALKFVNSPEGRQLRLRGLNTRVVRAGTIRVGDEIRKIASSISS